jgi:hypothetical protein
VSSSTNDHSFNCLLIYNIPEIIKNIEKCLPRVPDTSYDPSCVCLPGTRATLLNTILEWTSSNATPDIKTVFWLTSEAGVGKSTVAHTIATQAAKRGQLAACFFLDRDYIDKRNPRLIVNTLAVRLAHFNSQIANGIHAALEKDLDLGYSTAISHQFQKLIVEPIIAAKTLVNPMLIVIDDLDALDSTDERKFLAREAFLDSLAQESQHLPGIVKILITSRTEHDIAETLSSCSSIYPISLSLQNLEAQRDIKMLANHLMSKVHTRYPRLSKSWPGDEKIQALVDHAAGLFIWITTACAFIRQREPEKRLILVLEGGSQGNAEATLDELYRKALLNHVDSQGGSNPEFYNSLRQIMGVIATLCNPLSPNALNSFLSLGIHSEDTIHSLQSFLQVTHVVQPVHPSFVEFLTNKTRCKDDRLFVDLSLYRQQLTKQCLTRMLDLSRDICHIGDSTKFNVEVDDLESRLQMYVPEDMQYACFFWAQHLVQSPPDGDLYNLVKKFCYKHLLHWVEALSLLKSLNKAFWSLELVNEWIKVSSNLFDCGPGHVEDYCSISNQRTKN